MGTGQLVSGVGEAEAQVQLLIDAISAAQTGAQQLSAGMVELQAGTGQLGTGATELADAIGEIVGQVSGFEAVRGQILAAIDRTLTGLEDVQDADAIAARDSLHALREQAVTAQLPPDVADRLNQLRDGSRQLANQLAVPGYAYHDGIYTATNGAADLASGLSELYAQTSQATEGVGDLVAGVQQIDRMSQLNNDKVAAVRAALPVPVAAPSPAEGTDGAAAARSTLAPVAAMLLAAMTVFSGTALAAGLTFGARRWLLPLGALTVAAAGTVLAGVIGTGLGAQQYAVAFAALLLGTLASAGLAGVLTRWLGTGAGFGLAGVFALAQTGLVGWVWRTATTAQVDTLWVSLSQAAPMHWTTTAVSAACNGGDYRGIVSAVLLSVLLAAAGLAGARGRG